MDWLRQLLEKLLSFIPRVWLMGPNEAGVRLTLGSHVKCLASGWYIYLPLFQEIISIIITPQVVDLKAQSVMTRDGKDLCVSGAVMYRVINAQWAILKVHDFDASIQTVSLGIIARYISEHNLEDCKSIDAITDEVIKGIKDNARGWGLDIMKIYLTDFGRTRNLRLLMDTNKLPVQSIVV